MTRPDIIPTWATFETVYPPSLDSWSGSSIVQIPPSVTYFSPGGGFAWDANRCFQLTGIQDNAALTQCSAVEAVNWDSPFAVWSTHAAACYDLFCGRWLVASAFVGGFTKLAASWSGGHTWSLTTEGEISSPALNVIGMCTRASDGQILMVQGTAAGAWLVSAANSGAIFGFSGSVELTQWAASVQWSTLGGVGAGAYFVLGPTGTSPTATGVQLSTSPDGHTWEDASNALPASMSGITGTVGVCVGAVSPSAIMFGLNGVLCVSADGVSWADVSIGDGGTLAGLSYDAANGYWVATTVKSNTLNVYSAADVAPGVVIWKKVRTFQAGSTTYVGGSCACDGGLWLVAMTASLRVTASSAGQQDAVYSQDLGATWHWARYTLPVKTGAVLPDTVLAGGNQFLAINAQNLATSRAANSPTIQA